MVGMTDCHRQAERREKSIRVRGKRGLTTETQSPFVLCVPVSLWFNLAAGLFDLDYFATLIVATLGASAMRQFALVTVGAFGERLRRQVIVGTPLGCTRLGMAPFWIWHENLAKFLSE
jgi:hypothetical protein